MAVLKIHDDGFGFVRKMEPMLSTLLHSAAKSAVTLRLPEEGSFQVASPKRQQDKQEKSVCSWQRGRTEATRRDLEKMPKFCH